MEKRTVQKLISAREYHSESYSDKFYPFKIKDRQDVYIKTNEPEISSEYFVIIPYKVMSVNCNPDKDW